MLQQQNVNPILLEDIGAPLLTKVKLKVTPTHPVLRWPLALFHSLAPHPDPEPLRFTLHIYLLLSTACLSASPRSAGWREPSCIIHHKVCWYVYSVCLMSDTQHNPIPRNKPYNQVYKKNFVSKLSVKVLQNMQQTTQYHFNQMHDPFVISETAMKSRVRNTPEIATQKKDWEESWMTL